MSTRHFALAALALGLLLAPRAAWAQTDFGSASAETKDETLTIRIDKYGEFLFLVAPVLTMDVDSVQLKSGGSAAPVSAELAFSASANTIINVSTEPEIDLEHPTGTTLVADVEMDRWDQDDLITQTIVQTSNSHSSVPSGDNNMILRVTVDPALHSNSPGGVWSVLLPAGAYTNTTDLVLTMTAGP